MPPTEEMYASFAARLDRLEEDTKLQTKKLDQILALLEVGKVGAAIIRWAAAVAASCIAAWAALRR